MRRPDGDADADINVARGSGRGKRQLVRRNAHDGPVALVQRVDVVGAVAGGVNQREPFRRELSDERARHAAQRRENEIDND